MKKRTNNAPFERIQNQLDFEQAVKQLYASGNYTTEHIARTYGITPRSVQRIAKKWGIVRTQAEGNRVAAPLKRQRRIRLG